MDEQTKTELEAAAFRRLVNIFANDGCAEYRHDEFGRFLPELSVHWYLAAAEDKGVALDKAESRVAVYGMPYDEWKTKYQTEASAEQKLLLS